MGYDLPKGLPKGERNPVAIDDAVGRWKSREAAKACIPAWATMVYHGLMSGVMVAWPAWSQRSCVVSVLQRPPLSMPITTSRRRLEAVSSG